MDISSAVEPARISHSFREPTEPAEGSQSDLTSTAELLRPLEEFRPKIYDTVKRAIDFAASIFLAAVTSPLLIAAWLVVRMTSPGAGIYTQTRVGLGGRHFRIYKIRTMTYNCEATTGGAKWSTPGDSRVTPVGRILRKLHIDELPQLWNVLAGDMSLVGPRPERPEFVKPLSASIPDYYLRLAVRPGVTGLAQIQLPPDTDLESVKKKVALDRRYIASRGLWLDLRLVLGTAIYMIGFSYESVRRLFALPRRSPSTVEPNSDLCIHSYTVPTQPPSSEFKVETMFSANSVNS